MGCGVSSSEIQNWNFGIFCWAATIKMGLFFQNKWLIKIIISKKCSFDTKTIFCFKIFLWLKDNKQQQNVLIFKSCHYCISRDTKIFFETCYILSKIYLLLYSRAWNSTNDIIIMTVLSNNWSAFYWLEPFQSSDKEN